MAYYDGFEDRPRRRRRGGPFFYSLLGAIIGGLLVLAALPFFIQSGVIRIPERAGNAESPPQVIPREKSLPSPPQTVNLHVNTAVADVVSRVEGSIVGVVNLQASGDFWSRKTEPVEQGTGSGVIFRQDGDRVFIVTNHHVIEGATKLEVVLSNGDRVEAKLIGSDSLSDLAVISIAKPKTAVSTVPFGNSDNIRPGEPAIAIGNPLGLDYSRTVTVGVISSTDRSIPMDLDGDQYTDWEMDVIQTDAAINPGNSGGALINIAGQLIGINSAKISEIGIEGMGFAIPINEARPILEDLMGTGAVKRPFLGVGPKDLQEIDRSHWKDTLNLPDDVRFGVVVVDVTSGGPADKAGLKELDVIVRLDDQPIETAVALRKYLYKQKKIGDTIRVTFYRDGELKNANVVLGTFTP